MISKCQDIAIVIIFLKGDKKIEKSITESWESFKWCGVLRDGWGRAEKIYLQKNFQTE